MATIAYITHHIPMPFIQYQKKKFKPEAEALIKQCNEIIAQYSNALTLRQLYYRLVTTNTIPNKKEAYDKLGNLISDARMAGLVDWYAITDRTRHYMTLGGYQDPAQMIRAAANSYRKDWWVGQEYRVEVWIEKEALLGVIEGVCEELDVPYFACKGYTSQSEMWAAAQRMVKRAKGYRTGIAGTGAKLDSQKTIILHFGDHDPSGIDMTRDITDRLTMFCSAHGQWDAVKVERIALTMDQIREYEAPPNPAKITDSRAAAYIAEYGEDSWELDALPPEAIEELIRDNVARYRDDDTMDDVKRQEEEEREVLTKTHENWDELSEYIQETY